MPEVIEETVAALRAGKPVVLPTDTVYGLCADAFRDEPCRRAYRLKNRPETTPSALVCSDVEMLLECVPELRGRPALIARSLLPGPYTLILPNPARRFTWISGTRPDTIGVRVPELPPASRAVVGRVGAVMATSANLHGEPDPRRLEDVPEEIRAGCGALVEGGDLPGLPSTVIDFTGGGAVVLREGAVPAARALAQVARIR